MAEDQKKQIEVLLQKHVQEYPIKLSFPANVFGVKDSKDSVSRSLKEENGASEDSSSANSYLKENVPLRTSEDFINFRLMETGLDFIGDEKVPLSNVTESLQEFISDLQKTGCYESVKVYLGREKDTPSRSELKQLDVVLEEKNWYKLYVGGGIKQDSQSAISSSGMIPRVQFETSASLINLGGHTDVTQLNYTVDQTSTPTVSLHHTRPLYTLLSGDLSDTVLNMDQGSKVGVTLKALIDTVDFEHSRSSKDHIQKLSVKIANSTSGSSSSGHGPASDDVYTGLEWTLSHRDVIPRRHLSLPYQYDASPEVISSSGPNLKHSITLDYRLNGSLTDDRFNPTMGLDSYGGIEVAGPPGDVGFLKCWGGGAIHIPLVDDANDQKKKNIGFVRDFLSGLTFHTALNGGIIKPLRYGGLCASDMTNISDRFYVGGSHQLRGFVPSGIGPRASTGGSSTPGGDCVGGDVFYTASTSLSVPFPGNDYLAKSGVRLFGFANVGTLTNLDSAMNLRSFINSSRVALGGGVSLGTNMGRLEATYSVPLRYGPRDARRTFQAGVGFTFG